MERVLFSCFDDEIVTTIMNMVHRNNDFQIVAILSANKSKSHDLDTTAQWLQFDSDHSELRAAFKEVDAVVGLLHDRRLTDIAQFAVHYNRPLIYCASHLTVQQEDILQRASYYTPVIFVGYQQVHLSDIIAHIAQVTNLLDSIKITGTIINYKV